MSEPLAKAYTQGTHRCLPPEATLATITPHLAEIGVTRCADVTGLDRIGIPVSCAIRPGGRAIQVTNGKGLSQADARVSALMEALVIAHAEYRGPWRRGSLASMRGGLSAVEPSTLPTFRREGFFSPNFVIDWVQGEELTSGQEVWLPASAVYLGPPMSCTFDSNGLASGNHLLEATLHALYEVIERDAMSRLSVDGRIRLTPRCRCIDLDTVDDGPVQDLHQRLRRADIKLVLVWLPSCIPIHTFWAVLRDPNPFNHSSMIALGYGTHLSVSVAATRAITEAAQTRITDIHGAREDLHVSAYQPTDSHWRLFAYFDRLEGETSWRTLEDMAGPDLLQDYRHLLRHLPQAGYDTIFRYLTRPPCNVPVVKVFVTGLQLNPLLC
jgi:ribosomal protein S12 methylthiotransferase accessory factor